jgi:hypothetical protein
MPVTMALALALAANPDLDEARALFKALHYAEALPLLKRAAESAGQTQAERREAYDLLARAWAAEGDLVATQAAYGELLAKDAYAPAPSDAAPKIREAFRAAKAALYPPGTVRLTRHGATVELFDPWGAVDHLEVHEAKPRSAPGASTTLQTNAAVEARGANGEVLASVNELTQPSPPPTHKPPRPKPAAPSDEPRVEEKPEPPQQPDVAPAPEPVAPLPPPMLVLVESRPTWRWPVSIALDVLAIAQEAVAIGLGVVAQNDRAAVLQSPSPFTQRDAFALAARQRTEASTANALFIGGAVFALAGILVFIFGPTQ